MLTPSGWARRECGRRKIPRASGRGSLGRPGGSCGAKPRTKRRQCPFLDTLLGGRCSASSGRLNGIAVRPGSADGEAALLSRRSAPSRARAAAGGPASVSALFPRLEIRRPRELLLRGFDAVPPGSRLWRRGRRGWSGQAPQSVRCGGRGVADALARMGDRCWCRERLTRLPDAPRDAPGPPGAHEPARRADSSLWIPARLSRRAYLTRTRWHQGSQPFGARAAGAGVADARCPHRRCHRGGGDGSLAGIALLWASRTPPRAHPRCCCGSAG